MSAGRALHPQLASLGCGDGWTRKAWRFLCVRGGQVARFLLSQERRWGRALHPQLGEVGHSCGVEGPTHPPWGFFRGAAPPTPPRQGTPCTLSLGTFGPQRRLGAGSVVVPVRPTPLTLALSLQGEGMIGTPAPPVRGWRGSAGAGGPYGRAWSGPPTRPVVLSLGGCVPQTPAAGHGRASPAPSCWGRWAVEGVGAGRRVVVPGRARGAWFESLTTNGAGPRPW